MSAKPDPFWIARIAAGEPPRLRNDGESVEDYRIAMGWDKPKADSFTPAGNKITSLAKFCAEGERLGLTGASLAEALSKRPEFADCVPADVALEEIRGNLKEAIARGRDPYLSAAQCAVLVSILDSAFDGGPGTRANTALSLIESIAEGACDNPRIVAHSAAAELRRAIEESGRG